LYASLYPSYSKKVAKYVIICNLKRILAMLELADLQLVLIFRISMVTEIFNGKRGEGGFGGEAEQNVVQPCNRQYLLLRLC
jgi:hypothetical protein